MIRSALFATAMLTASACAAASDESQVTDAPAALPFRTTVLADLDSPWAIAVLPDGRLLVTEKKGQMLLLSADGKQRRTVATVAVDSAGQGGLMDVVAAPDFAKNRYVYLSYSAAGPGGKGVVLARGKLEGVAGDERLVGIETLFSARPFVEGNGHYSGRIAFSPDGQHLSSPTANVRNSPPRRTRR